MPLAPNADFVYGQGVVNSDGSITLPMSCDQPGPGMPGDYVVTVLASEVATIASTPANQRRAAIDTLIKSKLQASYRPTSAIQAALDALVGQHLTNV